MGAYCDLCGFSRDACPDPAIVEKRIEITRTVSDLQALFEEIGRDHGGVAKSHSDYGTRKRLTRKLISSYDVISVQVLHTLRRTSDHFMKITVYLKIREDRIWRMSLPSFSEKGEKRNSGENRRNDWREMELYRWNRKREQHL